MKKKGLMFIIDWHIFPFDVLVCLGVTREEIIKKIHKSYTYKLNSEELEKLQMLGRGKTVMLEGGQTILWIKFIPKLGSGVLAHEIFHAVHFLLNKIGVVIEGFDKDELPAYIIEYLNNQIVQKIIDSKKK